jgi:hypothetical protein
LAFKAGIPEDFGKFFPQSARSQRSREHTSSALNRQLPIQTIVNLLLTRKVLPICSNTLLARRGGHA